MTTAAPSLEATSLRCLAVLELLRGRPDKARSMLADARQVVADLGLRHGLMETELFAGNHRVDGGRPGRGRAALPDRHGRDGRPGCRCRRRSGRRSAGTIGARAGTRRRSRRYAAESERLAGHNLKTAIAWRAVRAEILAAQGRHDEAVAMAREAVAVAAGTDLVLDHADACLALGRVLAAAGDEPRATDALRDAETLYAAKEAAISIGRRSNQPRRRRHHQARRPRGWRSPTGPARPWRPHGWRCGPTTSTPPSRSTRIGLYDDRRRLSGDPIEGHAALRAATGAHPRAVHRLRGAHTGRPG